MAIVARNFGVKIIGGLLLSSVELGKTADGYMMEKPQEDSDSTADIRDPKMPNQVKQQTNEQCIKKLKQKQEVQNFLGQLHAKPVSPEDAFKNMYKIVRKKDGCYYVKNSADNGYTFQDAKTQERYIKIVRELQRLQKELEGLKGAFFWRYARQRSAIKKANLPDSVKRQLLSTVIKSELEAKIEDDWFSRDEIKEDIKKSVLSDDVKSQLKKKLEKKDKDDAYKNYHNSSRSSDDSDCEHAVCARRSCALFWGGLGCGAAHLLEEFCVGLSCVGQQWTVTVLFFEFHFGLIFLICCIVILFLWCYCCFCIEEEE